jgi:hypothetical protein
MRVCRRQSERGYALLFVFALSTAMAMMLYLEMPRLAMEMQRNREDLLIWRGEQYARAIKVFAKKNRRYPQTIEELENTNGQRYLRRRYLDPMTGKDEWRLIHADGTGRLTDSLVQKQNDPMQDPTRQGEKSTNSFVSEGASFGSTSDPNAPGRNAQALNRRASEMPGAPGSMPAPGALTPAPGTDAGAPQGAPPGPPPGYQQQNVVPVIGPNGQPIQRIPGLPGQFGQQYPNQAANSQAGGAVPQAPAGVSGGASFGSGYSGGATPPPAPGSGNVQQAGMQPMPGGFRPGGGSNSFGPGGMPAPGGMGQQAGGIAVNPATQMIQQILTRPNPQGLQAAMGAGSGGTALGGGIAGVASKYDAEGIKIYKERTNYKEWEFVYDPSKDQKGAGGQQMPGQIPGTNSTQPGVGIGGQQGTGFGGQQGGFGGQPQGGFGGQQGIRR